MVASDDDTTPIVQMWYLHIRTLYEHTVYTKWTLYEHFMNTIHIWTLYEHTVHDVVPSYMNTLWTHYVHNIYKLRSLFRCGTLVNRFIYTHYMYTLYVQPLYIYTFYVHITYTCAQIPPYLYVFIQSTFYTRIHQSRLWCIRI